MFKKKTLTEMGLSDHCWISSIHHFSFEDYCNPLNDKFCVLRVLNDDIIKPRRGFHNHPHKDMEIICYVVEGNLTHEDSMGNRKTLGKDSIQYISAGTGIIHEEHNLDSNDLRMIQMWIYPNKLEVEPSYSNYTFNLEEEKNKWIYMISSKKGFAPVKINQDVNIYNLKLDGNKNEEFKINRNRQGYLLQIEGNSIVENIVFEAKYKNTIKLNKKEALEIYEEEFKIKSITPSHFLLIEMEKS
ncbi:MAG: pirin family protein [Clostridium argentinense]|nr:pirin family protein [Clostridium argentinense]